MPSLIERLRAEMEEAAITKQVNVVADFLHDQEYENLIYFQEVIEEAIQNLYDSMEKDAGPFKFGLFVNDQLSDEVELDENDPTVAMQIFLHQMGWADKLIEPFSEQAHVELLEWEDITDKYITFTLSPEDFKECFGRLPVSQEEMNSFHILVEKALKKTEHIDWDIVYSVVKDEMKEGKDV